MSICPYSVLSLVQISYCPLVSAANSWEIFFFFQSNIVKINIWNFILNNDLFTYNMYDMISFCLLCSSYRTEQHRTLPHLCGLISLISHADKSLQLSVRSSSDVGVVVRVYARPRISAAPLALLVPPPATFGRLRPKEALLLCVTVAGLTGHLLGSSGSYSGLHAEERDRNNCFKR